MADAPDSKSGPRKRVWVQVPPPVLFPAKSHGFQCFSRELAYDIALIFAEFAPLAIEFSLSLWERAGVRAV